MPYISACSPSMVVVRCLRAISWLFLWFMNIHAIGHQRDINVYEIKAIAERGLIMDTCSCSSGQKHRTEGDGRNGDRHQMELLERMEGYKLRQEWKWGPLSHACEPSLEERGQNECTGFPYLFPFPGTWRIDKLRRKRLFFCQGCALHRVSNKITADNGLTKEVSENYALRRMDEFMELLFIAIQLGILIKTIWSGNSFSPASKRDKIVHRLKKHSVFVPYLMLQVPCSKRQDLF